MKSFRTFVTEEDDHAIDVNLTNPQGMRLTVSHVLKGRMRHEPEAKEHMRRVEKETNEHPEHSKYGPWTVNDYRWQS